MGELVNSRGQELNTLYTTYPVRNGLVAWVDPSNIPSIEAGKLKFSINLDAMTYDLILA